MMILLAGVMVVQLAEALPQKTGHSRFNSW